MVGLSDDVGGLYAPVTGEERSTLPNTPVLFSNLLDDPGFATAQSTLQPLWGRPNFSTEGGFGTALAPINPPSTTEEYQIWSPTLPSNPHLLANPFQVGDMGSPIYGLGASRSTTGQMLDDDASAYAIKALQEAARKKREQRKPLQPHVKGTTYEVLDQVAGLNTGKWGEQKDAENTLETEEN
jgi:hypothetical protein